eukprot:TRINITY_DN70668_c0_g1_i1.p2 TRINITY_DN70668_c0_g1~~TRINITY_DN70668_c0_g1_i1.p2  ORF type:complete len:695 (+),score=239.84 TRINITY_DN70668_c0_g1_i1:82-2166(+)
MGLLEAAAGAALGGSPLLLAACRAPPACRPARQRQQLRRLAPAAPLRRAAQRQIRCSRLGRRIAQRLRGGIGTPDHTEPAGEHPQRAAASLSYEGWKERAGNWSDDYTSKLEAAYDAELKRKQQLRDALSKGEQRVVQELPDHMLRVALFGRPGVGKTHLFNSLCADRLDFSLRAEIPGTTSDAKEADALLGSMYFTAIDTPGIEQGRILPQVQAMADGADLALLVVDVAAGITADDLAVAEWLTGCGAPVLCVANKCDEGTETLGDEDLAAVGPLGAPIRLSARTKIGFGTLQDLIAPLHAVREAERKTDEWELEDMVLSGDSAAKEELHERRRTDKAVRIAIVGQHNVGKSTLVNTLLGYERMAVTDLPATTRDAVFVNVTFRGHRLKLFDCPGFTAKQERWLLHDPKVHPTPVKEEVAHWMHNVTLSAARWSSVILYVFDSRQGITKRVRAEAAGLVNIGRPVILVANKWDEVDAKLEVAQSFEATVQQTRDLRSCTLVCLSAKRGLNISLLMDTVMDHHRRWHMRVPKGKLNLFWHKIQTTLHIPVSRSKVRHMIQVASTPPTFVVFLNRQHILQGALARYLMNQIRSEFGLNGIPVRLVQRRKPPSVWNVLGYNSPQKVFNAPDETASSKKYRHWGRSVDWESSIDLAGGQGVNNLGSMKRQGGVETRWQGLRWEASRVTPRGHTVMPM